MIRITLSLLFLVSPVLGAESSHTSPDAPEAVAVFKEGVGITLSKTTRESIGLAMVEVQETALVDVFEFTAQVYRTAGEQSQNQGERQGYAYASTFLPSATADAVALLANTPVTFKGSTETGAIISVHDSMKESTGQCEVLLEIPDNEGRLALGAFVLASMEGAALETVVVPRTAILESSAGTFTYVLNGVALKKTAVTTGIKNGEQIAITDGLYSGDEVAATAVETLYLIELRATKGGGHSH